MPSDGAAAFDGAAAAELYDAARPGYPAAAIDWALPGRAQVVLDLGAGTGKLTAALAGPGRRIIAVDPAAPMLDRLRQAHPQAETRIGTAERTGLAGSSVDAVVVGAAFHWFSRRPPTRRSPGSCARGHGGVAVEPARPRAVAVRAVRGRAAPPRSPTGRIRSRYHPERALVRAHRTG